MSRTVNDAMGERGIEQVSDLKKKMAECAHAFILTMTNEEARQSLCNHINSRNEQSNDLAED